MARLTYQDAERIAQKGRPWTFRLEYTGHNAANLGGFSDKYWYATGRGEHEMVEVGWGKIGSRPQTMLLPYHKLANKVAEKLGKDYDYTNTAYVRMSPANIAKLGGAVNASPAPPVKQVSSVAPNPRRKVAPPKVATTMSGHVQSKAKAKKLAGLGTPWSLITKLRAVRQGTALLKWEAMDASGAFLLDFDATGGRDFAADYDIELELL